MDEAAQDICRTADAIVKRTREFLSRHTVNGQSRRSSRSKARELLPRLREATKAWMALQFAASRDSEPMILQMKNVRDLVQEVEREMLTLVGE